MNVRHKNERVRNALNTLNDALFDYYAETKIEMALIVRDKEWSHRSLNGKENVPDGISDEDLILQVVS